MNTDRNQNTAKKSFADQINRSGRRWCAFMVIVLVLVPVLECLIFGVTPDTKGLLRGLIATAPMYYAVCVVEVFTYFPMLGAGGSYISFIAGNISNLKLPCALNAMEQCDVTVDSEEGEVVSMIAIAVSSIVTTIIIILGVLLIVPLTPVLESPLLAPAFAQMIPALFGGLGVAFIAKNLKISILPLILMTVLFIAVPALNAGTVGIMVPVSVLLTVIEARIMYKKGLLGGETA